MPVALAPEAAALLSAIQSEDRVPYAIEGGARRRPLIANDLRAVLADASERQDRLREGSVIDRSVMSGKAARHVEEAWGRSEREPDHASRVSACVRLALLAAGCTIDELMECMGHAHLQMVDCQVNLPSPARTTQPTASAHTSAALGEHQPLPDAPWRMYCRAAIPLLLVAASLGHAAAAPETVTESDSGKTVTIAPHQLLRIKLDEAPDGGLGSVCFRYVGNAAGRTKLRLGEFQFGRRSSKPADSFRVTVRVR